MGDALAPALSIATVVAPQDVAFWTSTGLSALLTLTALEIVLGIDNIVFIAIIVGRLPKERRRAARITGLLMAMVMRLLLLAGAFWIMKLNTPFATIVGVELSGKSIVLLLGGLFLLAKATMELHHMVEGGGVHRQDLAARPGMRKRSLTFCGAIVQILLLDLVFSVDSVVTAVGMTTNYWIMATAVVIAIGVMLIFAEAVSGFVDRNPTMKTLALAFLVLIGALLVADSLGQHLNRGYVYFAMGFSLLVEIVNMRAGLRRAKGAEPGDA